MADDRKLIKFLSIPSRRTVKDFIGSVCRKLNFTRSNYKEINGLFVESLNNNRYHLHIYARDDEFKEKLENAGKPTSDPNYFSMEINSANNLFVLPPFNNSVYRVFPMERTSELFERVLEFTTGVHQTIMDILLLIEAHKFKFMYVVCNRAKTYIAFYNGTDAMEMMEVLRSQQYSPRFASCYAKFVYMEGPENVCRREPARDLQFPHNNNSYQHRYRHNQVTQRHVPRQQNIFRRYDNNMNCNFNVARQNQAVALPHHIVSSAAQHVTSHQRFVARHMDMQPYHTGYALQQPLFNSRRNAVRRCDNRINNIGGAKYIRVMFPDNVNNNQYEMRLVRRF